MKSSFKFLDSDLTQSITELKLQNAILAIIDTSTLKTALEKAWTEVCDYTFSEMLSFVIPELKTRAFRKSAFTPEFFEKKIRQLEILYTEKHLGIPKLPENAVKTQSRFQSHWFQTHINPEDYFEKQEVQAYLTEEDLPF